MGSVGDDTPPIGHRLNELSPLADFVAGSVTNGVDAVADPAHRAEAVGLGLGAAVVDEAAIVAVTAGLGECFAAEDETRSLDMTGFLGLGQRPRRPADVAYRREAAHQHLLHDARRAEGDRHVRKHRRAARVDGDRRHMYVAVDKPWHQAAALQVDGARHF